MKKFSYLSFAVLILAMFSFTNVGFSQTKKQTKVKVNKKVEQPTVKPTVAQPKVEEQVQQEPQQVIQPAIEQPVVSTSATPTVASKDYSHSINLEFGYDFLAKFKKTEPEEDYAANSLYTSSDEAAKYMNINLSKTFITNLFRFSFGLGVILPHDYDNKIKGKIYNYRYSWTSDYNYEQKLNIGANIQVLQLGYRIKFNFLELVPYAGLNVLYLEAEDSIEYLKYNTKAVFKLYKVLVPIYTGLNFIFAKAGPVSFYTGLELGYAIKITDKNDVDEGTVYDYKNLEKHSDPLLDLTGKVQLGTSFNF